MGQKVNLWKFESLLLDSKPGFLFKVQKDNPVATLESRQRGL